jgi:hypothetical protein
MDVDHQWLHQPIHITSNLNGEKDDTNSKK